MSARYIGIEKSAFLVFIAVFTALIFLGVGPLRVNHAIADTLYVDAGNPCPGAGTVADPYCSIQSAIVAAAPGDTIQVAAGTYNEALEITKPVNLVGAIGTILDGTGVPGIADSGIYVHDVSGVVINGVIIQNFNTGYIESIRGVNVDSFTVKNLAISNGSGHAINVYEDGGSSANVLIDNVCVGPFAENAQRWPIPDCGIGFPGCPFAGNIQAEAFRLESIDGVTVKNADLSQNDGFIGVNFGPPTTGSVFDSLITANWNGINMGGDSIIITGNAIFDAGGRGIHVEDFGTAPTSVTANGNNITGNVTGVNNDVVAPLIVDATNNWWGHSSGPSGQGPGSGDSVSVDVNFTPFRVQLVPILNTSTCSPPEPPITTTIPTLSEWGIVIMAGVLALFGILGLFVMRRRKGGDSVHNRNIS